MRADSQEFHSKSPYPCSLPCIAAEEAAEDADAAAVDEGPEDFDVDAAAADAAAAAPAPSPLFTPPPTAIAEGS